jgi:uncharacterized protein (TIGR03086 family)
MTDPTERHRRHAADFSRIVAGVSDWDAPTPVKEWRARDVVGHLTEWLPGLLSRCGVDLPAGPSAADDPVAAWAHHAAAVQALLEDPERSARPIDAGPGGAGPVGEVVDRLYTDDVYLHAWDLARASGQADGHDPVTDQRIHDGMQGIADVIRDSGQFGEQQPVPDDATGTERLMAFLGRDPRWSPPS